MLPGFETTLINCHTEFCVLMFFYSVFFCMSHTPMYERHFKTFTSQLFPRDSVKILKQMLNILKKDFMKDLFQLIIIDFIETNRNNVFGNSVNTW